MPFSRKRSEQHRALLNTVVTCKVMGKVFSGRSVNIDLEGMFVESAEDVQVGDFISLTLQIPSMDIAGASAPAGPTEPGKESQAEGVILQPRGRIVRLQKDNPAQGLARGIGVRFLDLTDDEADWIRAYVGTTGMERQFQQPEFRPAVEAPGEMLVTEAEPTPSPIPVATPDAAPVAPAAGPEPTPLPGDLGLAEVEVRPARPARYRLVSLLGRGGMGKVYKAVDNELGEVVAIKVLSGELAEDGVWVRRFKDEVRMMRRIRHPNVVQVYEFGQVKGGRFFAMEYVDGISLASILRDEVSLPLSRLLPMARQIASGLQAIHDQGIVHRDLKPQNILIEPGGRVALVDFGIARSERIDEHQTDPGRMMGTPFYMSPEQIRGQTVDGRSDLYSMGVILFEASTGELPFRGESAVINAYRTLYEVAPPPSSRNSRLPADFDTLVTTLLAKRPEDRYQTATIADAEIASLESASAHGGLAAPPASSLKILVVEPDQAHLEALLQVLHSAGCKVTEAKDGYEAMARVFEERFDLAILATTMPRIPGFEACQILQSNAVSRKIRILLTTSQRRDIEYAGFLGVECLVWGSNDETLHDTIGKLLQSQASQG